MNKIAELRIICADKKCDVLCLTETHLSSDIKDAEIFIENFTVFRGDRDDGREKGGSIIYVNNNIACSRIDTFDSNDSLAVLVDLATYPLIIACVYRSPSISYSDNLLMIDQIKNLKSLMPSGSEMMLVGDFNLPDVLWNTGTVDCPSDTKNRQFLVQKKFIDMFLETGLFWHLPDGTVTRRRMYNGALQESLLDQVLTSDPALILDCEVSASMGKSDHVGIFSKIKCGELPGYTLSEKKCWTKISLEALVKLGDSQVWKFTGTPSVEKLWNHVSANLQNMEEHVPSTKVKISANGTVNMRSPWDCTALTRKRRIKNTAWQTFNDSPTNDNFQYALCKSNELEESIKAAMIRYENKMTSGIKKTPKAFYRYVNSKRKVKQTAVAVKTATGHLAKSPRETANILADFFESTFQSTPSIPAVHDEHDSRMPYDDTISPVTEEELTKLLKSVNIYKSFGPDNIHAKLLKALSTNRSFIECIELLFNTCLKERKIPDIWKHATVIPIHKKGSVTEAKNYRPISLTSIIGKLYEKIIRDRILDTIEDSITVRQHGFVSKKSCLSNLLEATDYINGQLAQGEPVDLFYFDFQKAFDTVPHDKLMTKLKNMGVNSQLLAIINDFLSNRQFQVSVGDSSSDPRPVRSGVPQGSVLGPILFVLYINDMPENVRNLLLLFADDAKMCAKASSPTLNQSDLDSLAEWQVNWGLTFNTIDCKCKVMHLGKNNPENKYFLNGDQLPKASEEKDLGVLVTKDYSWQRNIDNCIKKAKSTMSWIMRVIIRKEKDVMLKLYKSMVRPHLEYCVQLWSPQPTHGNWGVIHRLEDVQREYTRQINGIGHLSYASRLQSLGITTLLERRARGDLIETFKMFKGFANYGSNLFRPSRSGYNILYPMGKRSNLQNAFINTRVIEYWNKLPHHVKDSTSVEMFKSRLESHKKACISDPNTRSSNFWELSDILLNKIDDSNRNAHIDFLKRNPEIAKHKKTNIFYVK